jgi:hypothetical protein
MRVGSRLAGYARLGSLYLFCRRRVYQRRLPPKLAPAERADVGFNGNMNAKRGSGACPRGVCHFRFLEVACSCSGGLPQDGLRWGQLQARVVRFFMLMFWFPAIAIINSMHLYLNVIAILLLRVQTNISPQTRRIIMISKYQLQQ